MSDLDKLKVQTIKRPKIKRYLEEVHFDFEETDGSLGPHIAMTSGLGAASLMNTPFMLKSMNSDKALKSVALTEEEVEILKAIGEWPVEGSVDNTIKPTNKTNNKTIKENDHMDEKVAAQMALLTKEMAELKKTNNILISKGLIKDFGFSDDVCTAVAEILADIPTENRELLVKAFEVAQSKVVAKAVVVPAVVENPLAKLLDKEAGFEDETSKNEIEKDTNVPVEKTLVEKLAESTAKRNAVKIKETK